MYSHARTTTYNSMDVMDQKGQHTLESTNMRSHKRVSSFYAQLMDLEDGDIVHLTAETLADEYEKQARMLEQIQPQSQPQSQAQSQPQSSGGQLRRQRRIVRQDTWSMDDLKDELPSDKTMEGLSQKEDQIMRQNDPIQHGEQSLMMQPESVIPVLAGQRRGKGYFSKFWARIRPSKRPSPSSLLASADEPARHQSGPQKPLRSRCSRRRKGQGFIGAPSHGTPTTQRPNDISAQSTIDLSAHDQTDPDMTLSNNQSTSSLIQSSSDTAVDSQSCARTDTRCRRQRSTGSAKSESILAHCSSINLSNCSIQSISCSVSSKRSIRSSRQRTDSAYSQTAYSQTAYSQTASSSSSRSRITSRTREAPQCKPPPRKLSIVVVGDGAVGKSAMTLRFLRDQFHDEYDPTIEDSYCKHITVDGQDYILDLTDTSGQFEYRSNWHDSFMSSADGFICIYSIASLGSFRELVGYRDQIWRAKDSEHVPIMMVGNKCDLADGDERRVGTNAVAHFAQRSNSLFLEASAKTGKNIDSVFIELVRGIEQQRRLRDGNGVPRGWYDRHSQERETRTSIKGFATNVTPPASALAPSRDKDTQRGVKNGHCGCTIM